MPTLSFSCPKCEKKHERIKPEMVGHKVKCQCGFVFRLGSKTDKQAWVADDLKRKKALKSEKKAKSVQKQPDSKRVGAKESKFGSEEILDAFPVNAAHPDAPVGSLFDSLDEILDAIPANPAIPSEERITLEPVDGPIEDNLASFFSPADYEPDLFASSSPAQIPLQPLPVSRAHTRKRRPAKPTRRGNTLKSPALSIWNLMLSFLGMPLILILAVIFGRNAYRAFNMLSMLDHAAARRALGGVEGMPGSAGMTLVMFINIILCLLFLALVASMLASAIVSIIELAKGVQIKWATNVASTIASIVLVALFLTFFWQVYNLLNLVSQAEAMGNQVGRASPNINIGRSLLFLTLKYVFFSIVPIAVAITGFSRTMTR